MSFAIPQLVDWRARGRDYVQAKVQRLEPRALVLPNSPLRVMSDNNAAMAFEVMLYLQWLSRQLLPDTAEDEWLERFAAIWLPNNGRKQASYAAGTATLTGIAGSVQPAGTIYNAPTGTKPVRYQQVADVTLGPAVTVISVVALDAGAAGNLALGTPLSVVTGAQGVNPTAIVVSTTGGADAETNDDLRYRVLQRIQKPPMGGDADDYEGWALQVPGVTRAWCSPNEMGIGTVTVRFMMDDLRKTNNPLTSGFPLAPDLSAVQQYIEDRRPVTVKDLFVVAPTPEPIDFTVANCDPDDSATRAAIAANVIELLANVAKPAHSRNGVRQAAQTIYNAWVNDAIYNTPNVQSFDLDMTDHVMPTNSSMAVLGTIARA